MRKSAAFLWAVLAVVCDQGVAQPESQTFVEVLRDVRLEPQVFGRAGEKGRLDYFRTSAKSALTLNLARGQRVRVLRELGEGSCRIEIAGDTFDLQSCPWLPGFVDGQDDVYRVISE